MQRAVYYYLLKLFKPWRQESDLSPPDIYNHETFLLDKEKSPYMMAYHEINSNISQQDKEMEDAIRLKAQ